MFNFRDGSRADIIATAATGFILGFLGAHFFHRVIRTYGVALLGAVGGAMLTIIMMTPLDIDMFWKQIAFCTITAIFAVISHRNQDTIKLVGTGIIGSALSIQGIGAWLGGFPSMT